MNIIKGDYKNLYNKLEDSEHKKDRFLIPSTIFYLLHPWAECLQVANKVV